MICTQMFTVLNFRSNRQTIKKFFGDLSSSSKTLASLVKSRIPSFQKKEEILDHMAEYQVRVDIVLKEIELV